MAKKTRSGEVNKAQAMRELLAKNPQFKAAEAVATLGEQGIKVVPSLYYYTKGRMSGKRGRRKKARQMVANVTATMGTSPKTSDVISTIIKVKTLAGEVGGLKKLRALIDALEG